MTRKRFIKLIMSKPGYDKRVAENRVKHFLGTKKLCEALYAKRNIVPMEVRQPHLLTYQRYWDNYEKPNKSSCKKS